MLKTVDLGSFNIKTDSGSIYENRFVKDNNSDTFGSEVLEYNGNKYFFRKGKFNRTFSKAHKEIEIPLLYALGKDKCDKKINLMLHLPLSQFSMKNLLIERLQGKTFSFKINDVSKKITLNKVVVVKEGWTSFYSLNKRNNGLIAIIDIGGRTTDVYTFIDGRGENEDSINLGTMNLFNSISDALNNKGQNRSLEDIHKLIEHNIIDINNYNELLEDFSKDLINEIKLTMESIGDYQIYLTGGGSKFCINYFKDIFKNVSIMNNCILSNVNGGFLIGKAKGLND